MAYKNNPFHTVYVLARESVCFVLTSTSEVFVHSQDTTDYLGLDLQVTNGFIVGNKKPFLALIQNVLQPLLQWF